ncbi:MAG: arylsulfatase A [Halieaceae bacterium]
MTTRRSTSLGALSMGTAIVTQLVLALTLSAAWPLAVAAAPERPNIVVLYTDDMGWGDIGAYGNPYIRTPSLDRLAAEGQRWTDFYVPAPVCSPSRAALLTGKQPVRSGLYGQQIPVMFPGDTGHGIPERELTMAEALKSAGYATGMFGKWHLGDAAKALPTRHGFDYWFGVPYSNDMNFGGRANIEDLFRLRMAGEMDELQANYRALLEGFEEPDYRNYNIPLWRSDCRSGDCTETLLEDPLVQPTFTRRLTEEAIAFMRANREKPFFVYLPYSMPHLPIFASEAFQGSSPAGPYGDTIEEIDWSVGQIRAALEELDIDERTLVIFSSDNGPWQSASTHFAGSAGPLRGAKQEVYEGGVRVPGIFWWPGTIKPQVTHDIGSVMDVYTTALSLAGVAVPSDVDGFDLTPVLLEGRSHSNDEIGFYRKGVLRAYRKGDYKLHLYGQAQGGKPLEMPELYDLRRDISEREDIAAKHPERVAELLAAIARHEAATPRAQPIFDRRLRKLMMEQPSKAQP